MTETIVQRRKRKQMLKAYEIYKKSGCSPSSYREIAVTMCIAYNTAKNWISKMKEQEGDNE